MPSGLKTWLPSDISKQEFVTEKLVSLYKKSGYEPIAIPTLVDFSVVEKANKKFTADVFKLIDKDGNLLALRTEMTQPIAKAVVSRASEIELPVKLYYNSSVFRYRGIATDDSREIQQIGVECIGDASNDSEIVETLLKSLDELDIEDYKVSITDARIWGAIFEKYPDIGYFAYMSIINGDLIAFKQIVKDHEINCLLNSDIDVIEKVLELDLSNLKSLIKLDETIVFDSLQSPDINLYTGIHFNVLAPAEGKLLAIGGRYDKLCSEFGKDLPAIGFAFYLPRLISVMDRQGLLNGSKAKTEKVLKIAVSKGTLLDGALDFLKTKGLEFDRSNKRKLILDADGKFGFDKVELLLVRGHDVPVYVDHGAADLGVVGLDTVIDAKVNVLKLKDLDYGHCKLCVCAPKDMYKSTAELPSYTRVATTFPNLSKEFFANKGLEVEIINLYGSVELGPLTELSDVIVDLVATGKTLEENGLEVLEEILPCSAILISNQASFKLYKDQFLNL